MCFDDENDYWDELLFFVLTLAWFYVVMEILKQFCDHQVLGGPSQIKFQEIKSF